MKYYSKKLLATEMRYRITQNLSYNLISDDLRLVLPWLIRANAVNYILF